MKLSAVFVFIIAVISLRAGTASVEPGDVIEDFNELYEQIRDGKIGRDEAVAGIDDLTTKIADLYFGKGGGSFDEDDVCFPLKGYGKNAIGGKNGSGYVTKGYDFFDGNKHGGHPAHDIFIYDKNQDSNDDRTGNPVDVLAMTGGIVVALSKDWNPESDLRGGKFVMIYVPSEDALYYYAHNNKVTVDLGDIVTPCEKIAEIGRTGLNAYKQRSPTHLHISRFLVNGGNIMPDDLYQDLLKSKTSE